MIYRYPLVYRVQALLGALFAGIILLGSVIAEIEAADLPDAALHGVGLIVGLTILTLGVDFGRRQIIMTAEGLGTRWLRSSFVPWSDVLDWRYLPLSLIHIRLRHGPGWFVWPILERYSEILEAIDEHKHDRLMREVQPGQANDGSNQS
jgi:hypothetical protein